MSGTLSESSRKQARQLQRCGIAVLDGTPIVGQLGKFTFRFQNYYWVVDGPMPLEAALKLYADPIGKTDIRCGGHCGALPPEEYGADYFDSDGNELFSDPDGKELATMQGLIERGCLPAASMDGKRFVPDKRVGYARAEVRCYHVDSELGLYILANAIRGLEATDG